MDVEVNLEKPCQKLPRLDLKNPFSFIFSNFSFPFPQVLLCFVKMDFEVNID